MSRYIFALCFAGCLIAGGAMTMEGQQIESALYDREALRIESRWGNQFLVRGREGTVVGKLGGFRGLDLATAVGRSPNAVAEAREHNRSFKRGSIGLALGILAWGVGGGIARMDGIDANVAIPAWTAVAAGTALMVLGGVQLNKAATAMARSIWWYNRDLGR